MPKALYAAKRERPENNRTHAIQVLQGQECSHGFLCSDGTCISDDDFCDPYAAGCRNGEHKILYDPSIHPEDVIKCRSKLGYLCLLPKREALKYSAICRTDVDCRDGFLCRLDNQCILSDSFCRASAMCRDGSDWVLYDRRIHTEEDGIKCRSKVNFNVCLLPKQQAEKRAMLCHRDHECNEGFLCDYDTRCVPKKLFCFDKATPYCRDRTDIIIYNSSQHAPEDGIKCRNPDSGFACLLPAEQMWKKTLLCKDTECEKGFLCDGGTYCVDPQRFCGPGHCSDGTDAILFNSSLHTNEDGLKCRSRGMGFFCLLPKDQAWKNGSICHDDNTCEEGFRCADGIQCIEAKHFCTDTQECRDDSDRALFDSSKHSAEDGIKCLSKVWPVYCFLPRDQAWKKEFLCFEDNECEQGLLCDDGTKCVKRDQFCMGGEICRDGTDGQLFRPSLHTDLDGVKCRSPMSGVYCLLPKDQAWKEKYLCHEDVSCSNDFLCASGSKCVSAGYFCLTYGDFPAGAVDGNTGHCNDNSNRFEYGNHVREGDTRYIVCYGLWSGTKCALPVEQADKADFLCHKDSTCEEGYECLGPKCIPSEHFCSRQSTGGPYCENQESEQIYLESAFTSEDGVKCRASGSGFYCLLPKRQVHKRGTLCHPDIACSDGFLCNDGLRCVGPSGYCDGGMRSRNDCYDESDEVVYDPLLHTEDDGIPCQSLLTGKFCLLPKDQAWKREKLCLQGFVSDFSFLCLGNRKHISIRHLCDGNVDCEDLSDECICDGSDICSNLEWGLVTDSGSVTCNSTSTWKDSRDICSNLYECDKDLHEKQCLRASEEVHVDFLEVCKVNGHLQICQFLTLMEVERRHFMFQCSYTDEFIDPEKVCDGTSDCDLLEDEEFCPVFLRHMCRGGGEPINVPRDKVCDLYKDCVDSSDELGCTQTRECKGREPPTKDGKCLTHYYCEDDGDVKFIDSRKLCDGNLDCFSGVDESLDWCIESVFSDTQTLIASPAILPFIWVISIVALIGNFLVFLYTAKSLLRPPKKQSVHETGQQILVLNLSIADLLVGVYTTSVCIENIVTSQKYWFYDQTWRSGASCSAIGAILVMGSEQSVFALALITGFRLRAILRPFSHVSIRHFWFCMLASWVLAIMLAVIPLVGPAEDFFLESIWYAGNPIFTYVAREEVEEITTRLMYMLNKTSDFSAQHGGYGTWSLLEATIHQLHPTYLAARRFGYYSAHGVCLPRLFPDTEKIPAWSFSLLIILTNFSAFFFILFGYVAIFKGATKTKIRKSSNSDQSTKLQRRVTRIVISDFLCWMPVCIMVGLQLSGIDISTDVYVPVGMILIPINSALNPFLYSDAAEIIWNKIRPYWTAFVAEIRAEQKPGSESIGNETATEKSTRVTAKRSDMDGLAVDGAEEP